MSNISNMNVHREGIVAAVIFPIINENLKGGDRRPGGASTPWTWTWALPTSSHAGGARVALHIMLRRKLTIIDDYHDKNGVVAGGSGKRRE